MENQYQDTNSGTTGTTGTTSLFIRVLKGALGQPIYLVAVAALLIGSGLYLNWATMVFAEWREAKKRMAASRHPGEIFRDVSAPLHFTALQSPGFNDCSFSFIVLVVIWRNYKLGSSKGWNGGTIQLSERKWQLELLGAIP